MGIDNSFFQVHLIDFGLSKRYIDPSNDQHIPSKTGKILLGSVEYASINNHNGKELSRRDDLESLAYLCIHLLLGNLPWSSLVSENSPPENESEVLKLKQKFFEDKSLRSLPPEFALFLESVRNLAFEEEPRYTDYRRMFKELMIREGLSFDYIYDWVLMPLGGVGGRIGAIDDLLALEDSLTKEEEDEIATMMQKYEEDPTIIDFKLEEIRKQNKKFDVVSPGGSPKESLQKGKQTKGGTGSKASRPKASKSQGREPGRTGKDKKDCTLI